MILDAPFIWVYLAMLPFWQQRDWQPKVCNPTTLSAADVHGMDVESPQYEAICPIGKFALVIRQNVICCTYKGGWYGD